jgi:hypothetical protein
MIMKITKKIGDSLMYVILYACIITDDENGLFVDHTFLGGIAYSRNQAEEVVRDITNDKSIPGTTISRILPLESRTELPKIMTTTNRYFHGLANDMYDMEAQREK